MTETVTNELGQTFPKPPIIESTHGELDYTGSYGGREIICARLRWEPSPQEYNALLEVGFHNLEWVSDTVRRSQPEESEYCRLPPQEEVQEEHTPMGGGEWTGMFVFVALMSLLAIFTR